MRGTRQGHHAKVEHSGESLNEGDQPTRLPTVHAFSSHGVEIRLLGMRLPASIVVMRTAGMHRFGCPLARRGLAGAFGMA